MLPMPRYPRWYWQITLAIAAVAGLWGLAMVDAALDHNPQGVYTDDPSELNAIFISWFVVVFGFFEAIHQGIRLLTWVDRFHEARH